MAKTRKITWTVFCIAGDEKQVLDELYKFFMESEVALYQKEWPVAEIPNEAEDRKAAACLDT